MQGVKRLLTQPLPKGIAEGGYHLEKISHHSVAGNLEDGSIRVFINGYHQLCRADANDVLDGPRDATGYVKIGGYHLAGLSHLVGVGDVSTVHSCAARPHGSAQNARQFADQLEALLSAPDLGLFFIHAGWRRKRRIV